MPHAEPALSSMTSRAQHQQVIFCSICGFTAFRVRDLVNHLATHSGSIFACGLDRCPRTYTNLRSFKSHLEIHHHAFYPDLIESPEFSDNSIFSHIQQILEPVLGPADTPEYFVPSPHLSHSPNVQIDSIDASTKEFLEIILKNCCNFNIPFKAMPGISTKLARFFYYPLMIFLTITTCTAFTTVRTLKITSTEVMKNTSMSTCLRS